MVRAFLKCISCKKEYDINEWRYFCNCDELLDVAYDFGKVNVEKLKKVFDKRRGSKKLVDVSGVWRFRELLPFLQNYNSVVSMPEGNTNLYNAQKCAQYVGLKKDFLQLKHQGMNPTGSFKDNGMTTGISQAKALGAKTVACASTGNTSASMAAYAARAQMQALVLIPEGEIAYGKLSQALDYGAATLQVKGDFDTAMNLVLDISQEMKLYLLNSVNPFRLEGQKTIIFEMLQQRNWKVPDRIVVPGGNLGNSSAFGKALIELSNLGFINEIPKITIIQAEGANPFYTAFKQNWQKLKPVKASTLATAIKIGNPVNWKKAMRSIKETKGIVEQVSESQIADAKAIIGKEGIGSEPASATTIAGIKKLIEKGKISSDEEIVAILTGNLLKDTSYTINYHTNNLRISGKKIKCSFANKPIKIEADKEKIKKLLSTVKYGS